MTLTEHLKSKYPDPKPADENADLLSEYCVGGAFCLNRGNFDNFPTQETLAIALKYENLKLSEEDAYEFAIQITDNNDREDFEGAWRVLEEALNYQEIGR